MKKFAVALLALASAAAIAPAALADTYTYSYTYTDAGFEATGTLTGTLISAGVFDITSGTVLVTGDGIDGTGILVQPDSSGNFYTGGGTILTFADPYDSDLYTTSDPEIDDNGAFLFDINTGAGAGDGLAIFSLGPDSYGGFGGNYAYVDLYGNGSFSTTYDFTTVTPEPSSMLLLATGLVGAALVGFRKATA